MIYYSLPVLARQPLFPSSVFKNKNMASEWQLMEGGRSLGIGKKYSLTKIMMTPIKDSTNYDLLITFETDDLSLGIEVLIII